MGKIMKIKGSNFSNVALGKAKYLFHSSYMDESVSKSSGCYPRKEGLLGYICFDADLAGKTVSAIGIYSKLQSYTTVNIYRLPNGIPSQKIKIGALKGSIAETFNVVDVEPTEFSENDLLMIAHDYNELPEKSIESPLSIFNNKNAFQAVNIEIFNSETKIERPATFDDNTLMYKVYIS